MKSPLRQTGVFKLHFDDDGKLEGIGHITVAVLIVASLRLTSGVVILSSILSKLSSMVSSSEIITVHINILGDNSVVSEINIAHKIIANEDRHQFT